MERGERERKYGIQWNGERESEQKGRNGEGKRDRDQKRVSMSGEIKRKGEREIGRYRERQR